MFGFSFIWSKQRIILDGSPPPPSPSSFYVENNWEASQDAYIYEPEGYADNTNDYPIIIFLHGAGQRGSNITQLLANGPPKFFNEGEEAPCLLFMPQLASGLNWSDSASAAVHAAVTWVQANLRVDANRIYLTGLSLGATGASEYHADHPGIIAAHHSISGTTPSIQANPENYTDIASMFEHGTADGFQSPQNSRNAFEDLGNEHPDLVVPSQIHLQYGEGHVDAVWNDIYDRNNASPPYDYVEWLLLHSRDEEEQGDLYVTHAETTEELHDYLLALHIVNKITAGAAKTALLSRLDTLAATADAGSRVIVNFGTVGVGGTVNDITSAAAGVWNNLVDVKGNNTGATFEIVNALSTSLETSGLPQFVYGLDRAIRLRHYRVSGSRNIVFGSLNPGNNYKLRFYTGRITTDWNQNEILEVTINAVTRTTSGIENTVGDGFIEFDDIQPDGSDEITINLDRTGPRDCSICAIVLIDKDTPSTPDTDPPGFTTGPTAENITANSVTIRSQMDEPGDIFALVVTDGAGDPGVATVIATGDSIGNDAAASSDLVITGLAPNTPFDCYVALRDKAGNVIGSTILVEFTTLANPSAIFNLNASAQSISGYNDVSGSPHSGVVSATDGATGWTLRSAGTWNSFGGSSNNTGGEDTDDGGGFAYNALAQRSIWYSYLDAVQPIIELDNLDDAKTYTIILLCTIDPTVASASPCEQEWTIGATPLSVVARGNTSMILMWTGVVPSSNLAQIIGTDIITATGNRFFTPSVVEIKQE